MHPLLKSRLEAIRNSLLATYQGGDGLPNNMIGAEREVFVQEFLAKVFPPNLRFVGGAIIDSISEKVSGEIDIAVLLPTAPSFPLPAAGDKRLIFAENAAAVIEVKSNLSTQWNQVIATTKKVKGLHKHIEDVDAEGLTKVCKVPVMAVGFKGWKDVWALKKKWEDTPEEGRPDAVLMIDNPAFVSPNLQAESVSALIAFITCLDATIRQHHEYKTDLMRYIGPVAQMENEDSEVSNASDAAKRSSQNEEGIS